RHRDPAVDHAGRRLDHLGRVIDGTAAIARVVPDLPRVVGGVCHPDFALVGSHADAMAVALAGRTGNFKAPEHLAGLGIANLEADQTVHVDVDQAAVMVDGERAHHLGEGHVSEYLPARHVDDGYSGL